jgi:hypothetical protein
MPRLVPAATAAVDFVNSRRVRPFLGAALSTGFLVVFFTSSPPYLAHRFPMRELTGPWPGAYAEPGTTAVSRLVDVLQLLM